jgi:pSer/pThr/pTyr-binding forkhead associated (FHA) protein
VESGSADEERVGFLELGTTGASCRVNGHGILIGRQEDADLVLRDPRVSESHAMIFPAPGAHVIRDLGSTSGTFVNGRRVREARLADGDRVQVGPVKLRYSARSMAGLGLPASRLLEAAPRVAEAARVVPAAVVEGKTVEAGERVGQGAPRRAVATEPAGADRRVLITPTPGGAGARVNGVIDETPAPGRPAREAQGGEPARPAKAAAATATTVKGALGKPQVKPPAAWGPIAAAVADPALLGLCGASYRQSHGQGSAARPAAKSGWPWWAWVLLLVSVALMGAGAFLIAWKKYQFWGLW